MGVYSINYGIVDVRLMIGYGLLGYFVRRFNYEVAPLPFLALGLGPMLELI